jgi:hypothetical protein
MEVQVNQERLAKVQTLFHGSHPPNGNGTVEACVMEAVAYVAGEPWSDTPECVCPVLTAFMMAWNDGLPNNQERDRLLKPLIPRLVGTRSSKEVESRRATMAADWLIRVHTPAWLRLAKLNTQAELLEALPEITDFAQCPSLMPTLRAVRKDADAAGAAARAAAGAAAWDTATARDAAWAAAGAAAGAAAWDAAWDAAGAAAWDAATARDAAWAAAQAAAWATAGATLAPTLAKLQQSTLELVERMINVK